MLVKQPFEVPFCTRTYVLKSGSTLADVSAEASVATTGAVLAAIAHAHRCW